MKNWQGVCSKMAVIKRKHKTAAIWLIIAFVAILVLLRPEQHKKLGRKSSSENGDVALPVVEPEESQDDDRQKEIREGIIRELERQENERIRASQEKKRREELKKNPLFVMELTKDSDLYGDPYIHLPSPDQVDLFRNAKRVVYPKIPRTGSSTFRSFLSEYLAPKKFTYKNFDKMVSKDSYFASEARVESLLKQILEVNEPAVITLSVPVIDHRKYAEDGNESLSSMPVYIGLVREPMKRLASLYYDIMSKDNKHRKPDFDKCVLESDPVCLDLIASSSQMAFFCGSEPVCQTHSRQATIKAMHNLDEMSMIVGVTQDIGGFVEVLEWLMPQLFAGTSSLIKTAPPKNVNKYRQPKYLTEQFLREKIDYEYEFYGYARRKFEATRQVVLKKKSQGIVPS